MTTTMDRPSSKRTDAGPASAQVSKFARFVAIFTPVARAPS